MSVIFKSYWTSGNGILDGIWTQEDGTTLQLSVDPVSIANGFPADLLYYYSNTPPTADYLQKNISGVGTIGIRFAFLLTAFPGTTCGMLTFENAANSKYILTVEVNTAGALLLYNQDGGAQVGSSLQLSTNTVYQVEVLFINNTQISMRVWNAAGTSLVLAEQKVTSPVQPYNCDTVYLGQFNAPGGSHFIWEFATFVADNSGYPGPFTQNVTYNGNGNTGGSVPTDSNMYGDGDTVTVLGNTGSLTKTGNTFKNWNTAANGSGTSYSAGNTFTMGTAAVTLYAQWTSSYYPLPSSNPTY